MKLQVISIEKDGVIHLSLDGRVTSQDFADINANPLETTIGPGWAGNRVLLDLTRVDYFDSSAIGWLLQLQKGFRNGGGAISLWGITPSVMQLFVLLKLTGLFKIAETEAAARELLATTKV